MLAVLLEIVCLLATLLAALLDFHDRLDAIFLAWLHMLTHCQSHSERCLKSHDYGCRAADSATVDSTNAGDIDFVVIIAMSR